ncbi:MAG TPA: phosphatidylserine decarboxylase family protein [Sphingobacteriaceae bacterium]|nr:phosphatidylserine decarboxylase family protein [Sphingobacteriaceae bacterium]
MTIHKEGYDTIAVALLLVFIIDALVHYYLPGYSWLQWIIYLLSLAFFVIILQFFRSPETITPINPKHIICPADGKVVVIEETTETEFLKDKRIQVSIFMSPLNVHINRQPVSGIVKFLKYHPGKFLFAWDPKSSTDNERTTVVVETKAGVPILFRQIAGALARRIVWYVKENDAVKQGDQFGFIKFGSRVDVFFPLGTKINVGLGEKVTGGVTVLAEF